jgi:hypothetical protein
VAAHTLLPAFARGSPLRFHFEPYRQRHQRITSWDSGKSRQAAYGRCGPWLCENAKTLNRDRRSYSSKTVLVAQHASGFNLEIELKNIILRRVSILEFSHSQGQTRTHAPQQTTCTNRSDLLNHLVGAGRVIEPRPSRSVNRHHAARRDAYGGTRDGRHDAQSRGRAGT